MAPKKPKGSSGPPNEGGGQPRKARPKKAAISRPEPERPRKTLENGPRDVMMHEAFGKKFAFLLKTLGFDGKQVGDAMRDRGHSISKSTVNRWTKGRVPGDTPRIGQAITLAEILGVTVDSLVDESRKVVRADATRADEPEMTDQQRTVLYYIIKSRGADRVIERLMEPDSSTTIYRQTSPKGDAPSS